MVNQFNNDTKSVHLFSGVEIPCIGFGTSQIANNQIEDALLCACREGYRHIDTADAYGNEESIGKAIDSIGIPREELFITSKLRNRYRGYKTTIEAFERTLERMELDYLDLFLIHWPANRKKFENWDEINQETWKAMTEIYKSGKVRAIGVSNFLPKHLKSLMETEIPPMVNQIEYHPGWRPTEITDFCHGHNIIVEGWSPLGNGKVLHEPTLIDLAKKYGRTPGQICIRWCLQNGVLPLPKSVTPSRIAENIQVFDFEISREDMNRINDLEVMGWSGLNPDEVEF